MNRRTAFSALQKDDVALAERYGKIGIRAVAAAARYQEKARNDISPAPSRAEDERADKSKRRKRSHPMR